MLINYWVRGKIKLKKKTIWLLKGNKTRIIISIQKYLKIWTDGQTLTIKYRAY